MTDSRTNYGKQIDNLIRQAMAGRSMYSSRRFPGLSVPLKSVRQEKAFFAYDPKGKVAEAYKSLTKEVLADADRQRKLSFERAR